MRTYASVFLLSCLVAFEAVEAITIEKETYDYIPPDQPHQEEDYAKWLDRYCDMTYEEQEQAKQGITSGRGVGTFHQAIPGRGPVKQAYRQEEIPMRVGHFDQTKIQPIASQPKYYPGMYQEPCDSDSSDSEDDLVSNLQYGVGPAPLPQRPSTDQFRPAQDRLPCGCPLQSCPVVNGQCQCCGASCGCGCAACQAKLLESQLPYMADAVEPGKKWRPGHDLVRLEPISGEPGKFKTSTGEVLDFSGVDFTSGGEVEQPEVDAPGRMQTMDPRMQQPYVDPRMRQPYVDPRMQQPYVDPRMRQPYVDPRMQQPYVDPRMRQPYVDPRMQQPYVDPRIRQPYVDPRVQQPYYDPRQPQPYYDPRGKPVGEESCPMLEGPRAGFESPFANKRQIKSEIEDKTAISTSHGEEKYLKSWLDSFEDD